MALVVGKPCLFNDLLLAWIERHLAASMILMAIAIGYLDISVSQFSCRYSDTNPRLVTGATSSSLEHFFLFSI